MNAVYIQFSFSVSKIIDFEHKNSGNLIDISANCKLSRKLIKLTLDELHGKTVTKFEQKKTLKIGKQKIQRVFLRTCYYLRPQRAYLTQNDFRQLPGKT